MEQGHANMITGCHRVAVVFWPRQNINDVLCDATGFKYACSQIYFPMSRSPSWQEAAFVDFILSNHSADSRTKAADVVCNAARNWKDFGIWLRAMKLYGSLKPVGNRNVHDAVSIFGIKSVAPMYYGPIHFYAGLALTPPCHCLVWRPCLLRARLTLKCFNG